MQSHVTRKHLTPRCWGLNLYRQEVKGVRRHVDKRIPVAQSLTFVFIPTVGGSHLLYPVLITQHSLRLTGNNWNCTTFVICVIRVFVCFLVGFYCGSNFLSVLWCLLVTSVWQTVRQDRDPQGWPGACWQQNLAHLPLEVSFAPSREAGENGLFPPSHFSDVWLKIDWWFSKQWSVTPLLICTAANSLTVRSLRCN